MNLLHTLRVALRALMRNKMRSFLTTLGMIIGVAAVIFSVAVGEGAKAKVEEAFASMGSNLLIVLPGSNTSGGARGGSGSQPTLTWDDMKAIRAEVPGVRFVAPRLHTTGQVVTEDQNWATMITGTTPEFFEIRNWPIRLGSGITPEDTDAGAKVTVLGETVAANLFGASADPVGQSVRIQNVPFRVVGVAERKGQSPGGSDYDDVVYVPVSTFLAKIQGGLQNYLAGTIMVEVTGDGETSAVAARIAELLRDRHNIAAGADDDFTVKNLTETANRKEESTQALTLLLASIAAVSLLVGGIGIMNIMLVSVTERTREIGVRVAVGAKPRHILIQFLIESLALSVMGGLAGVGLGLVGAQRLALRFAWPMLVRVDVIGLAVGFSALVGIAFGLYPAYKAARLDPIVALRYE
jgi:putative ABC transport system permease protein